MEQEKEMLQKTKEYIDKTIADNKGKKPDEILTTIVNGASESGLSLMDISEYLALANGISKYLILSTGVSQQYDYNNFVMLEARSAKEEILAITNDEVTRFARFNEYYKLREGKLQDIGRFKSNQDLLERFDDTMNDNLSNQSTRFVHSTNYTRQCTLNAVMSRRMIANDTEEKRNTL